MLYLKNKKITYITILVTLLIIVSNTSYAIESDFEKTIFFKGDIKFDIAETYLPGETIDTDITISNLEKFPIAQAYLTVEIVEGCKEPAYPSQISDCDNIFYEKTIDDINIASTSDKKINFIHTLPQNIKSGDYRIDIYLRTKRSPIIGMAHILLPGKHKSFSVTGTGTFPEAKILRTKTYLISPEYIGPVGAPAEANAIVAGKVYIEQEQAQAKDYTLEITVCQWDDISCEKPESQEKVSINTYNTITITDISFKAPERPDAYAVRLELKDKDGKTVSLYRSRLIVTGKTANIRKIAIDKPYYSKGENGIIKILISGPPDHYTNPTVRNAKLTVYIKDQNNYKIFEESKIAQDISETPYYNTFSFSAAEKLDLFYVCAEIESEEKEIYDSYCFTVDSQKFISGKHKFTFDESYDITKNEIIEKICVFDLSGLPVTTEAELLFMPEDMSTTLQKDTVSIEGCTTLFYSAERNKKYLLMLTDLEEHRQHLHKITASELDIADHKIIDNIEDNIIIEEPEKKDNKYIIIAIAALSILALLIIYRLKKK